MKDLLALAIAAAEKAGGRILTYYNLDNRELGIQTKRDDSPVTLADLAADASIRNDLLTQTDYPVVSEEQLINEKERLAYETYWLVDPLDGTKDFIQKNCEFSYRGGLSLPENSDKKWRIPHSFPFRITSFC